MDGNQNGFRYIFQFYYDKFKDRHEDVSPVLILEVKDDLRSGQAGTHKVNEILKKINKTGSLRVTILPCLN